MCSFTFNRLTDHRLHCYKLIIHFYYSNISLQQRLLLFCFLQIHVLVKEMADDQVPIAKGPGSKQNNCPNKWPKSGNGQTVKSTPPSSENNTEAPNKRKRKSMSASPNNEKETKIANDTPVADTTETRETDVDIVETAGVKEVEMKDAESLDGSSEQGIKEVEMQDADITHDDQTRLEISTREEGITRLDVSNDDRKLELNATEERKDAHQGIKETEKPTKVEASENNEKGVGDEETRDGSGQRVLGEVATLLKQVEESDAKAKLEVEVKVKKMDHGDVKENGEINKS